jgi:hypothetical protein
MTYTEKYRLVSELSFKVAETFFKYITWFIIIAGLRYGHALTNSSLLGALVVISQVLYMVSLMTLLFYMAIRDPATYGVPEEWRKAARERDFVISFLLLLVLSSPYAIMDQLVNAIIASRK